MDGPPPLGVGAVGTEPNVPTKFGKSVVAPPTFPETLDMMA